MSDVIRMEYAAMDQLIAAFHQAHDSLAEVKGVEKQMAQLIENGAMLGAAGEHLASAIAGPLVNATTKLQAKMEEEVQDCRKAMEIMKQHDQEAGGKFR